MNRDERLIAYVDGELEAAERTDFEAEIAADPALAARVAQHRELRDAIGTAYAPVLEEPVPPHLVAMASAANEPGRPRFALPHWGAVAASLVAGVIIGHAAWPEGGVLQPSEDGLRASGALAQALDERLASEAGPIRVGLSFRTQEGRYCRTFQSAPDRLAGVACRGDEGWTARMTTAWAPSAGPQYRTAASDIPPEVLAAVDGLIAGEALDPEAERAARDRRWKP